MVKSQKQNDKQVSETYEEIKYTWGGIFDVLLS